MSRPHNQTGTVEGHPDIASMRKVAPTLLRGEAHQLHRETHAGHLSVYYAATDRSTERRGAAGQYVRLLRVTPTQACPERTK